VQLQRCFGLGSIVFFSSAVIATGLFGLASTPKPERVDDRHPRLRLRTFNMAATSVIAFGVVCIAALFVAGWGSAPARMQYFYVLSAFWGAIFGSLVSLTQDCLWQVLPPDVGTAHAMGYSSMWRMLGLCLSNIIMGVVLNMFPDYHHATSGPGTTFTGYRLGGYVVICVSALCLTLASATILLTVPRLHQKYANGTHEHPPDA